jgi:N-acetylneuraminic acid mutarotase
MRRHGQRRARPQLEALEARLAPNNLFSLGDALPSDSRFGDPPLWTATDLLQDRPDSRSHIPTAADPPEHGHQLTLDTAPLFRAGISPDSLGHEAVNPLFPRQPLLADARSSAGLLPGVAFLANPEEPAEGGGSTAVHPGPSCSCAWVPKAPMAEARGFFTATTLEDGRVLVSGGYVQRRVLAGSEIYNPRTDTWMRTGDLQTARSGNGAVLLRDGRVLAAGGLVYDSGGGSTALNSAEIFDPATGSWAPTGSMNVARVEPFLTLLNDGKVLAAGETRAAGPLGKSAEVYDPDTGQWTRVADMNESRSNQVQLLLPDGRVLVAGGYSGAEPGDFLHASAELYDPRCGTWTPTGDMTMARADPEGVVLTDGRVLVTGGNDTFSTRTNTAEIYDPATGEWARTSGSMSEAKVDHTMTLLDDGRVLTAGGLLRHDVALVSADLYDPQSDTWTPVADMCKSRGGHQAVLLGHSRVLVIGGLNFDADTDPEHGLASTELYHVRG